MLKRQLELKDARNQLKVGLAESRRSIETLRAAPLEELGLHKALEKGARIKCEIWHCRSLELEYDCDPISVQSSHLPNCDGRNEQC